MKARRNSLCPIALLCGLGCAGCFDFSRALDPCRVDADSEECLNANSGSGGLGAGGSAAGSGGDGSGGSASGASGGVPASGGLASGGNTSGGGSGGQSPTGARISVSEIFLGGVGFLEIVNSGTAAASITGYSLGASEVGPEIADSLRCQLVGDVSLSPGEVAVAAKAASTCDLVPGGVICISSCPFTLTKDSTIYVFDAEGIVVASEPYPSGGDAPSIGQSWQALPPESGDFLAATPTPGS